MKVLIIGGTGFISGEIARLAHEAGHELVLLTRGEKQTTGPGRMLRGDGKALLASREALRAERPDVVIHAVASTEEAGRELGEVFDGMGVQALVLSSMDGYAVFQEGIRQGEAGDHPVDEAGALTDRAFYYRDLLPNDPKRRLYDKNQMTAAVLAAHAAGRIRASVYRLPFVYGPGDAQYPGRHGPIIRRLLDARPHMLMGLQDQGRLWTWGYVTNIAAALVHAIGRPEVDGRIYNLAEPAWRSKRRWAALYAHAAGRELAIRLLPDHLLDAEEGRDQPPMHVLIDAGRFPADTGFVPPVSLEAGIARTYAWAAGHPACLGDAPDYEAEDRLLAAYDAALAGLPRL